MSTSTDPRDGSPVRISPPDPRLQTRVGGPARNVLTPGIAARASAALGALASTALDEVRRGLETMEALARERPADAAIRIRAAAHEIRGVAGSFERERLGRVATCICAYIDNCSDKAALDANALTILVIAARQTLAGDTDDLADELVEECEALVARMSDLPGDALR